MLDSFRRAVGIQITRHRFRKSREKVISFTQSLSSASRALLIMPFKPGQALPADVVIELIKQKFSEENITVVTADQNSDIGRILPRATLIRVPVTGLTWFSLPRKNILEDVHRRQYDLAIDLNLDLVLPSAYICRESNARVRVGFVSKRADMFYNFQIQPNPSLSRQLIYDRLAKCLGMF
jgi:ADP-heptose:LPS heptosyltransferase